MSSFTCGCNSCDTGKPENRKTGKPENRKTVRKAGSLVNGQYPYILHFMPETDPDPAPVASLYDTQVKEEDLWFVPPPPEDTGPAAPPWPTAGPRPTCW